MQGRLARPAAFRGDDDAQDEVLAKVVVDDGPCRGREAGTARFLVAPPRCSMVGWCSPVTVQNGRTER